MEIAIIATDIGTAIGPNLIFGIPVEIGVMIAAPPCGLPRGLDIED